jgi:hypothetical protein
MAKIIPRSSPLIHRKLLSPHLSHATMHDTMCIQPLHMCRSANLPLYMCIPLPAQPKWKMAPPHRRRSPPMVLAPALRPPAWSTSSPVARPLRCTACTKVEAAPPPRPARAANSQLIASSCPGLPHLGCHKWPHMLMVATGSSDPPLSWTYSSNFPLHLELQILWFTLCLWISGWGAARLFYVGSRIRSLAARPQRSCSSFDYRLVLSLSLTPFVSTKIPESKLERHGFKTRFYIFYIYVSVQVRLVVKP